MSEPDAPERMERESAPADARRRMMGRPGVVPGGADWRLALEAYVSGHDRGFDAERKMSEAIRATGRTERAERDREVGAGEPRVGQEARPGVRHVPPPERFDFHRGAGTWRRHLPLGRRGGRDVRDHGA